MTGILFAFAGCTAMITRKRFEEQLPLAVGLVVSVLYGFALFGQLQAGAYVVLGAAAAALAGQAVLLIRDRARKPWRQIITPGCMAFFLIALWLLISFRGYMFWEWDDFSHWGLAVKNMYIFTALPSGMAEATVTYTDYPPATTLFSWFWTQLSGVFNEGDAQRALNMMTLCFLLPAMKDQEWKHPGKALCMSALLFMLPLALDISIYRGLQVDGLLGCMILYALYAWFLCDHDRFLLMNIGCTLFLLPLVKEMGVAFAAVVLLFAAADHFVHTNRSWKNTLKLVVLLAIPIALGKLSWDWYLKVHQVGQVWDKSVISLTGFIDVLLGRGMVYQQEVLRRFPEAFFSAERWHPGHILKISYAMWIILTAVGQKWIVSRCCDDQQKKRLRLGFRLLLAGMIVYLAALFVMYLFMFRSDEARKMISFDRYLSSYLLPMIGMTFLTATKVWVCPAEKGNLHAPLCILVCLFLVINPLLVVQETVLGCDQNTANYEKRMDELLPENVVSHLDSETDRVYIVACGDDGFQYYLDAYQLTPVHIQEGMWTTWPVAEKTDLWTEKPAIEYAPSEWAQALLDGSFTHVYLDTIDERFVNDYSSLFEAPQAIQSAQLYHVEAHGDGVKLAAVQ